MADLARGRLEPLDVWIEYGRVAALSGDMEGRMGEQRCRQARIVEAEGCIVAPGLVDVHVHFRDPGYTHKEDLESGARAAARGGYTSVVLMANTSPCVDNVDTLAYIRDKARELPVRIYTCATVTQGMRGRELTDMEGLQAAGAVGFTDDGMPILDAAVLEEAMLRCKALDAPLSLHEEDPRMIGQNGIDSQIAVEFGLEGSPREAEESMVARDVALALTTGAKVNVQHVSAKGAVEALRRAKARGGNVHGEAAPHHFVLTREAVREYGTLAKMNPPLRGEEDRLAILEGLADGTLDLIATDHAPHSRQEKALPLDQAPSGIVGLETALPLCWQYLVVSGLLDEVELLRKMSKNPAELYGLEAGFLAEGGPGDVVVIDPKLRLDSSVFYSKSDNSPFAHWDLQGAARVTICRGRIVYQAP